MIRTIDGTQVMGFEEVKTNYATACEMLRAGLGQEMWTAMRMTYRAAAQHFEDLINMMDPHNGVAVIAEIRNYDC